jgi:uncharacterized protein (TIGR00255 family)
VIRSMTGFGSAQAGQDGFRATVEVRSLNHRHLRTALRLPKAAEALEPELTALVASRVRRGSVTLTAILEPEAQAAGAGRLDLEALLAWQRSLEEARARLGPQVPPASLDTLLGLPGVLRPEAGAPDSKGTESLREAAREALEALDRARLAEGGILSRAVASEVDRIRALVPSLEARAAALPREIRDRLLRRVQDLMAGLPDRPRITDADLAREACLIADRADLSEELTRFRAHLDRIAATLAAGGEVGRTLDFLVQESLREANTLGAKAGDAGLVQDVIAIKCGLERIREQVQNLE